MTQTSQPSGTQVADSLIVKIFEIHGIVCGLQKESFLNFFSGYCPPLCCVQFPFPFFYFHCEFIKNHLDAFRYKKGLSGRRWVKIPCSGRGWMQRVYPPSHRLCPTWLPFPWGGALGEPLVENRVLATGATGSLFRRGLLERHSWLLDLPALPHPLPPCLCQEIKEMREKKERLGVQNSP